MERPRCTGRCTATTSRSPTCCFSAGARANAANDLGTTPLHLACTNRNMAMVERLLTAGANVNATLLNGETVLMACARAGDAASVKAVLARHPDVNAKEREHQQTALMWAASQRHPDVVQLLIEAGADIRLRSLTYPQTVVGEQTQRAGREELNYTVLRGGATPLLFAARVGDVESARLLLKAGADPNDAQPDGVSALVLAAHSGHGNVGALLLEHGADPNAAGSGYSALHAAILRSDLNLVKALLARGADPNARISKGTPMRRDTTDWNLAATLIGSTPYCWRRGSSSPRSCRCSSPAAPISARRCPTVRTGCCWPPALGSSKNASRRGIETIDFGKVEPESRVREAVADGNSPRRRRQCGVDSDRRHRAPRRRRARLRHRRRVPGRSTAPGSARRTSAASTPLAAAMFGSTTGRGGAAPRRPAPIRSASSRQSNWPIQRPSRCSRSWARRSSDVGIWDSGFGI